MQQTATVTEMRNESQSEQVTKAKVSRPKARKKDDRSNAIKGGYPKQIANLTDASDILLVQLVRQGLGKLRDEQNALPHHEKDDEQEAKEVWNTVWTKMKSQLESVVVDSKSAPVPYPRLQSQS